MGITRLKEAGATIEKANFRIEGFPVDAQVSGSNGQTFLVLTGERRRTRSGWLRRTDTVEKAGFMAMQLARRQSLPIILITSDLPKRSTRAGFYLAASQTISGTWCPIVPTSKDSNDFRLTSQHPLRMCRRPPMEGSRKDHFTKPVDQISDADAVRAPTHIARPWTTSATSSQ